MGDNNVTVSESELVALGMVVDAGYDYPSHLVDFAVTGADLGHTYKVVMPLSQPLPNGAVYRKYLGENIGWQMFVENADNAVATASALKGACPHTGSEVYTPGLTAGDNCLQLLIQDGGPNDSDGAVNGTTTDTGGIAVKFIGTPSKNSEVILRQTVITANAVDSTVVTVTAYDDQGVGLEHMSVTGSMPLMGVVVSDFVEQGSGVYTATVTGGMTAGSGPVTVVIDNGEMSVMLLSARLRLASVSVSKSGGGGCTVASDGSADASLLLLLIIAGLLLARRRYQFN
jgi:MYXO-CTERM domain-containing protein